jgi:hypothetical protein
MHKESPRQAGQTTKTQVGVQRLTPETTKIFEGTFSLLHCRVRQHDWNEVYRGVFAVLLFPISHPDGFISLRYTDVVDDIDKIKEIGVIETLSAFPEDQQNLIRDSLARHYYEKIITRVHSVRCEYGLLFFDVETQEGREQFMMPWRQDRAEDFGASGKVLLDAHDNRYIVPDLASLPTVDRRRFTSYIYW